MLSTVEALEQIALQMPAVDRFLNHFFLFLVPHRIVQHFLQHPQRPQLSGTYIAQKGAVVTAVSPPVFLLPAGVIGEAVDELVQLARDLYTGIRWIIILKVALILPGSLPTAVADNALFGLLKGPCVHGVG